MSIKKNTYVNNLQLPKSLFWCFSIFFLITVFTYGYLVRSTIANIVDRKDYDQQVSVLTTKLTTLETEYIQLKNSITMESAKGFGFQAARTTKFVAKNILEPAGLSLVQFGN